MDVGPSRAQRVAVLGLELVEIAVVDDARDHVARVERDLEIWRDDAEEFLGVVARFPHLRARLSARLGPVEPRHDPTPDPDRILFVGGVVVGKTRRARVHLSAAKGLVVAFLAGGHLHQRRSAEEHLGASVDHHDVIAHARDVRSAGRRVTEDQCDGRDTRRRQPRQIAEHPPAGDEHLLLRRQIGTTRLDERDHRESVLHGDIVGAQCLTQRPRIRRPALDRRVTGNDETFDPLDDADPHDDRRSDVEVRPIRRERAQFEKVRILVEQHLDALTRGHLAALAMPLDVLVTATREGLVEFTVYLVELLQHRIACGGEVVTRRVDRRTQCGHRVLPCAM